MPIPGRIYACITVFLVSCERGVGFIPARVDSSSVAILRLCLHPVGCGSTSGTAGEPCPLPPRQLVPTALRLPFVQGGEWQTKDGPLPNVPGHSGYYLSYVHGRCR